MLKLNSFQFPDVYLSHMQVLTPEEFYVLFRLIERNMRGKSHTPTSWLLNESLDFSIIESLQKKGYLRECKSQLGNWELLEVKEVDEKPRKRRTVIIDNNDPLSGLKASPEIKAMYLFVYKLLGYPEGKEKSAVNTDFWIKECAALVENIGDFDVIKAAYDELSQATINGESLTLSSPKSLYNKALRLKHQTKPRKNSFVTELINSDEDQSQKIKDF